MVKNLSEMQETPVWSLGREDPLQKGMATHTSILAWRIPWTEETGGLWSTGSQSGPTERLSMNAHTHIFPCLYAPGLLYPFICQWAFRLIPCHGYCKQCCNEYWGACIFLNYGFLQIYAQE